VKVLILAYDFPPFVSVGGRRPNSWFQHFKEFGLEPVVVTRQYVNRYGNYLDYVAEGFSDEVDVSRTPEGTVVRAPYRSNVSNLMLLKLGEYKFRTIRRGLSLYFDLAQFFLPIGPRRCVYVAAREFLKENHVDVILATGEPFVLFHYAAMLAKEFRVPWVADYRDPWSQSKLRARGPLGPISSFLERRAVKTAAAITTVSPFFARHIQTNLPGRDISVFYNGYDEEPMAQACGVESDSDNFIVAFAGSIYPWHPLESFLKVCWELLESSRLARLRLRFYGVNNEERLRAAIDSLPGLADRVEVFPRTLANDLAKVLPQASVFLMFNDYSILGSKVFTYLALRRKVLLCYGADKDARQLKQKTFTLEEFGEDDSVQSGILEEANGGVLVRNASHLRELLEELHDEYSKNGFVDCESKDVERYSRRLQAEAFANWLRGRFGNGA
jgi:hypothetical protein